MPLLLESVNAFLEVTRRPHEVTASNLGAAPREVGASDDVLHACFLEELQRGAQRGNRRSRLRLLLNLSGSELNSCANTRREGIGAKSLDPYLRL